MFFTVSHPKKKTIESLVIRNNGKLQSLDLAACYVLPIFYTVALGRVLAYAFVPDLGVTTVNGIPTKDWLAISATSIVLVVIGHLLRYCLRLLVSKLASKDLTERVNEELYLSNGTLRYVFRVANSMPLSDRIVVSLPLDDLNGLIYEDHTKRIILRGRISSTVVNDYNLARRTIPNTGNLSSFTLYDYFEPSLYQALRHETGADTYIATLLYGAEQSPTG